MSTIEDILDKNNNYKSDYTFKITLVIILSILIIIIQIVFIGKYILEF